MGTLIMESSLGRYAAEFAELLTRGAEYLTRNMTSRKFFRATQPTVLGFNPKTDALVKL